MTELKFKLEGQLLSKQNEVVISAGDENADKCIFEFDNSWSNLVKTAVFYQEKDAVQYAVLGDDNTCLIPAPAMQYDKTLFIGVFGVGGSVTLTSTVVTVEILEGATTGITLNLEPSDDVFLAIVAQYQNMSAQMVEYNTKAAELISSVSAQNQILQTLNAFDVVAVAGDVEALQTGFTDQQERVATLEAQSFILTDQTLNFGSGTTFDLTESRITDKDIVDVYFTEESYEAATDTGCIVDSKNGFIRFTCVSAPEYPLYCTIIIRKVG